MNRENIVYLAIVLLALAAAYTGLTQTEEQAVKTIVVAVESPGV